MAAPIGKKRNHEIAFPQDTSSSSPSKRRREDVTDDVARPHFSVSSDPTSEQSLNTKSVQLLSPSTASDSGETTQEATSLLLTDSCEIEFNPTSKAIEPLPKLMQNPSELSIVARLLRRELGMPHQLTDPIAWQKKGEDLFDQDKYEGALKSFQMAERCYRSKGRLTTPELLEITAKTQYKMQHYSDALKAWDKLANQSPIDMPQACLWASLCMAKQGDWESFSRLIYSFHETLTLWLTMLPSRCPLSQQQLDTYRRHIFLDVINEFVDMDAEGDSKTKIREAIYYVYNAMNYYDGAFTYANLLQEEYPELRTFLQMRCGLEKGPAREKEAIYAFLENNFLAYEQDESGIAENMFVFPHSIIKLVFNEGLQHRADRPLKLASDYLLVIFNRDENDRDGKFFLLNHLFFCTFALGHYDRAIELASTMDQLDPGIARVQQALCTLAKGEALTNELISNFTQAIEKKNTWLCDPIILTFVSKNLRQYKHDELDKIADRFQEWAGSFIK